MVESSAQTSIPCMSMCKPSRAVAIGPVSSDREGDFAAMLTFSNTKIWLDASDTRERAHVEGVKS